jgi:serine/threonine-protein kinase
MTLSHSCILVVHDAFPETQTQTMIGKTVGNYRIVGRLGEGGMGEVFLAAHPELGRKAAVKILREDLARGSEHVQRFLNEARAADSINHPAIVKVLDMGTMPSGAPYIVMELLEGETLGARLQRCGRFDPRAAADIIACAADALAAAHAAGIVHRDLKPDNLFLIQDTGGKDVVKVLDFGIAKLGNLGQKRVSLQTRTGVIMGTPVYMSPELCSGARQVDHRSDVYSLGIILYEMLCGEPPFQSEGFGELAHLHLSAAPTPPRERNPDIPEALSAVVLRALAKAPTARFASMAELGAALAPWTSSASAPSIRRPVRVQATVPMAVAPPPARSTPTIRRRGWLVVASALVVAGFGGAYLWSLRSPTAAAPEPAPRSSAPRSAPPAAPPPTPESAAAPAAPPPAAAEIPTPSPPAAHRPFAPVPSPGESRSTTTRRRPQHAPAPAVVPPVKRHEPVPL